MCHFWRSSSLSAHLSLLTVQRKIKYSHLSCYLLCVYPSRYISCEVLGLGNISWLLLNKKKLKGTESGSQNYDIYIYIYISKTHLGVSNLVLIYNVSPLGRKCASPQEQEAVFFFFLHNRI